MTPEEWASKIVENARNDDFAPSVESVFAAAIRCAVAEEREACAKVAEMLYGGRPCTGPAGKDVKDWPPCVHQRCSKEIAAAIRARG